MVSVKESLCSRNFKYLYEINYSYQYGDDCAKDEFANLEFFLISTNPLCFLSSDLSNQILLLYLSCSLPNLVAHKVQSFQPDLSHIVVLVVLFTRRRKFRFVAIFLNVRFVQLNTCEKGFIQNTFDGLCWDLMIIKQIRCKSSKFALSSVILFVFLKYSSNSKHFE